MSQALAVTSATWDKEVLQSDVPVLVDFWAAWCRPCLNVAPELNAVAEQLAGKAKVVTLDIDTEPNLATKFGIIAIPALFIFKDGQLIDKLLGAHPRQVIAAKLAAHV